MFKYFWKNIMILHILIFFSEGTFEIDDYNSTCYLYECVAALRALLLQKTAPSKYKKVNLTAKHNAFYFFEIVSTITLI